MLHYLNDSLKQRLIYSDVLTRTSCTGVNNQCLTQVVGNNKKKRFSFNSGNKICILNRDVAPEGATLAETNKNLDEITDLALELQKKTGVKLLWATCNLFAHSRYVDFLYNIQ